MCKDVGSSLSLPSFDVKLDEEQGSDRRPRINRSIRQLKVKGLPSSSLYSRHLGVHMVRLMVVGSLPLDDQRAETGKWSEL